MKKTLTQTINECAAYSIDLELDQSWFIQDDNTVGQEDAFIILEASPIDVMLIQPFVPKQFFIHGV